MTVTNDSLDIEAEAQRVAAFVERGNYHAAYNIALSGLNACRRADDQAGVDRFIAIIRGLVDTLDNEFGSKSGQDDIPS